ncbi:integrase, catalytic region, zinc finger, CCHC-type containing protein [Tanacetum coccineum]
MLNLTHPYGRCCSGGDGWEMMVRGRGGVAVEGGDEVEMVGDGVAVVGGSEMVVPWCREMKAGRLCWCGVVEMTMMMASFGDGGDGVQAAENGESWPEVGRNLAEKWVAAPENDPIACLNKEIAFLTAVASSRFPSTNNQLRTSSNPKNQATIQDGRVTVQQIQGRQGQSYSGTGYKSNAISSGGNNASGQTRVVKCYNCQGEGHMARQCTQPKRPRNAAWYKEKAMLAEAQEAGQILDEEQLAFLADPGVPGGQAVQTIIPNNAAFQTEDLDPYDSDCDDISNAKAVLMANISNYGSDVISEDFEQTEVVDFIDNEIHTLNIDLSSRDKVIESQMDDMIKEKIALKEQVDSLEQKFSKQIKEKECLLQTFTVFKSESKEKEDKYMENKIYLEKKINELNNILFKVGQSAQTVHMLTKPQSFYDNIHKQALGYQNPFHLKKAQRIKPTLYDGIVMSDKHVAMLVIDDEETLILEEESRSKMSEKEKDPEAIKQNISHKPIDYEKLNRLTDDFGKRFVPQQELTAE